MDEQLTLIPETPPTLDYVLLATDSFLDDQYLLGPAPDASLINSVRHFGVLTPIQVVMDDDRPHVVDGRRRLKAARATGLTAIPAVVLSSSDLSTSATSILANAQRSDNAASDLIAIIELTDQGATFALISNVTGLPIQTIKKRMKLRRLIPALLDAFLHGRIPTSVAERCSGLDVEKQTAMAALLAENGRLTMREAMDAKRVAARDAVADLPDDLFGGPEIEPDDDTTNRDSAIMAIVEEMVERYHATRREPTIGMVRRLADLLSANVAHAA